MTDYAKTLRELRGGLIAELRCAKSNRVLSKKLHAKCVRACREVIGHIRAIDAALCALRIVKPELQPCAFCMRRCMLDYDFVDTECCEDCAAGADEVLAESEGV